ncbi:transcription initiation protein [Nocardioides silvaticus]|uniref:Transcription initiation protein n=1 Tax=Nocardioides silvaticus TaxID=2201891 RepID=A0A316TRH4_9ACTN|nr:YciI family protein [Nocardioides silvaticus]PWN02186.1 transcription initiation protein [Nocardioides silvaticus]
MTTYVVLLPGDENAWEALSAEEQAAVFAKHEEFSAALAARGHTVTGGHELTHSRTTKQVRKSPSGELLVTDGPYAETVEQLSGFYVVESDDLDDLVQVCGILADGDGAVEVRAAVDHSGEE